MSTCQLDPACVLPAPSRCIGEGLSHSGNSKHAPACTDQGPVVLPSGAGMEDHDAFFFRREHDRGSGLRRFWIPWSSHHRRHR